MASIEGTRQESMEQLGQSSKENANLKTELQKTWHENQAMSQEVKNLKAYSEHLSFFLESFQKHLTLIKNVSKNNLLRQKNFVLVCFY